MKKIIFILSLSLLVSCGKDKNDPTVSHITTKDLSVIVNLPSNAPFDESDLTVSSLFSQNAEISDGQSVVEIFDENAIELVFATNSQGDIVLLNLVNPSLADEVELNATTTAQSLVLLHPWVMNLTVEARQEALSYVALMPDFEAYKNKIIVEIINGKLNPNTRDQIIESIITPIESEGNNDNRFGRLGVSKEIPPLIMAAEDGKVKVTNKLSSLAYNLQLYDENNEPVGEAKMVKNVNKEIFSLSIFRNILTGNFGSFPPENIEFPIPSTNQTYNLKADSWTGVAALTNGLNFTSSAIGIFSTTLGEVIGKAQCGLTVGQLFLNNVKLVAELLATGEITDSQAMSSLLSFFFNRSYELYNVIQECPGEYSIGPDAFKQMMKSLSFIGYAENLNLASAYMVDWTRYDSEIEFCFEKKDGAIQECDLGQWYVGTYTLQNWGSSSNTLYNCGSQYGQKGEVYIYIGDTSQEKQIICYYKTIINGLPNIYKKPFYRTSDINNENSFFYNRFRVLWQERIGTDPNNPSKYLYRDFSLDWLKITDDGNFISNINQGGYAVKTVPYGTGSSKCGGDYLFMYSINNINLTSVGANPPSSLNSVDLDRINTLLNDDTLSEIIVE